MSSIRRLATPPRRIPWLKFRDGRNSPVRRALVIIVQRILTARVIERGVNGPCARRDRGRIDRGADRGFATEKRRDTGLRATTEQVDTAHAGPGAEPVRVGDAECDGRQDAQRLLHLDVDHDVAAVERRFDPDGAEQAELVESPRVDCHVCAAKRGTHLGRQVPGHRSRREVAQPDHPDLTDDQAVEGIGRRADGDGRQEGDV